MAVPRPYRRIVRPFTDGQYAEGGRWMYIQHSQYTKEGGHPAHFIRAFLIIQEELKNIFNFIEPSDANLHVYSFKIHQLMMTTCMEIEANFKAIFLDNGCDLGNNGNILTYHQLEKSHLLSGYQIKLPIWNGKKNIFSPFKPWRNTKRKEMKWYQAYNNLKHNRHKNFSQANLDNLLNAIAGLAILLTAQFRDRTFPPPPDVLSISLEQNTDGFEPCIGEYFTVRYPTNWPKKDRYDFNWQQLDSLEDPFQNYPYQKPEKRCRRQKEG